MVELHLLQDEYVINKGMVFYEYHFGKGTLGMSKLIRIGVLLKALLATAVISGVLVVVNPVAAEAPPFGILLEDMWAFESEQLQLAFSLSPVPTYMDNEFNGPDFRLVPGTKLEFFFANEVEIFEIREWDFSEMGEHSIAASLFKTKGDGQYTFNTPGKYGIYFHGQTAYFLEVAGAASPSTSAVPVSEIKVVLDGQPLNFDVPPQIINGRTLVPLRVIFEALGASVNWNEAAQTVTAVKDNTTVSLRIGSNILTRNGASATLDVPPQIISSRTMVPARAIAEAFGANVEWVGATQTVVIISDGVTVAEQNAQNSLAGTYWQAVSFKDDGFSDEAWADIFLWEGGKGYFRFSFQTPDNGYYGFSDQFDCNWTLNGDTLVIYSLGTNNPLYYGSLANGELTITYNGYFNKETTIYMDKIPMPAYGAQWYVWDLFGRWRMIAYSDFDGKHDVSNLPPSSQSELIIYPTLNADFYLNDDGEVQVEEFMKVTLKDGPLWKNSVNQAWHAELSVSSDPDEKFYVTFAEGQLLLTLEYLPFTDNMAFSAEFEYAGYDIFDL